MLTTKVTTEGAIANDGRTTIRIQHLQSNASPALSLSYLLVLLFAVGGADAFGLCSVEPRGRAGASSRSLLSTLSADDACMGDGAWASGFEGGLLPMRLPAFLSSGRNLQQHQHQHQHQPAPLLDLVDKNMIVQVEEEVQTNDKEFEHTFFLEYGEAFTDEYHDFWWIGWACQLPAQNRQANCDIALTTPDGMLHKMR